MIVSTRQLRRQAREAIHKELSFPVWYLADKSAEPVVRTIRLHTKFDALGELLRGGFADRQEIIPKAIFWNSQGDIQRNGFVITDTEGVFRLDNLQPADDQTRTCELVKMADAEVTAALGLDPSAVYAGLDDPEAS